MNDTGRVVKSEYRRFLHSSFLLYTCLGLITLAILLFALLNSSATFQKTVVEPRDEVIANHERLVRSYEEWCGYILTGEFPSNYTLESAQREAKKCYREMRSLELLLEREKGAQVCTSRFYSLSGYFSSYVTDSQRGTFLMFETGKSMVYPYLAIALLSAIFTCVQPFSSGYGKNYKMTPIADSKIRMGKMLYNISLFAILCTVLTVVGLAFGLSDKVSECLIFYGDEPSVASCQIIFLGQMLSLFLIMCVVMMSTCFVGKLFTNPAWIAVILVPIAALIGAVPLIAYHHMGGATEVINAVVPFVNMLISGYSVMHWQWWLMALFSTLFCVGCWFWYSKRPDKVKEQA